MKTCLWISFFTFIAALLLISFSSALGGPTRTITDAVGRQAEVPSEVQHVICSGAGALRLLTYLQAQDKIVAVDDMEKQRPTFEARPYALANPQFKKYPIFGEFRGHDHPEQIVSLDPMPQVIFKTSSTAGYDPVKLSRKTGLPVVVLHYGDLGKNRARFYQALRIMGETMGKSERAESVISFFDAAISDLEKRSNETPRHRMPTCFVGGIAYRGPHGLQSTEPKYPPFSFIGVSNLANDGSSAAESLQQSNIAKEKIVQWDPDYIFLDLSTLQAGENAGGLFELKTDPAYQILTAVKSNRVYGVFPYKWYTINFGSILANAYFIGKLLQPSAFSDVDPAAKADEIYRYLVGEPVFEQMNASFRHMAFQPVPLE